MTAADVDITARTLWGEARGEGIPGMQAVAGVIMNRVKCARDFVEENFRPHPLFGDGTFLKACRAPWQFSCWNPNDPNLPKLLDVSQADAVFGRALVLAQAAVDGHLADITHGATHYYDARMPAPPRWCANKSPCAEIGHHLFFNHV